MKKPEVPATQVDSDALQYILSMPKGTDLGTDPKPDPQPAPSTDLGTEPPVPEGEKKDAAPPPWAEFHGAPAEGADYEISAPDGYAVDEQLRAEFVPIARELNLSSKGAQRLVELKAKDIQLQNHRWGEHLVKL